MDKGLYADDLTLLDNDKDKFIQKAIKCVNTLKKYCFPVHKAFSSSLEILTKLMVECPETKLHKDHLKSNIIPKDAPSTLTLDNQGEVENHILFSDPYISYHTKEPIIYTYFNSKLLVYI